MERLTNGQLESAIGMASLAREGKTSRFSTPDEIASIASELLNLRRRDEELGFAYWPGERLVELLGTKFSRIIFERYRVSSGEDVFYQHVRDEQGNVIVSQHVGLREQLRLLREMLERRLPPDFPVDSQAAADWCNGYREWSEAAALLLQVGVHEVAAEAGAIEALLQSLAAYRLTLQPPVAGEDERAWHARQVAAAGVVLGWHDRVLFARRQLTLANYVVAGTCSKCGCTESRACRLKDGSACSWANAEKTLCTACADEAVMPIEGGAE